MRGIRIATVALCALGGLASLHAQQTATPPSTATRDSLTSMLEQDRATPAGRRLPAADRFTWGDLTIPAGATASGPVASAHGTVHVRGTVDGSVFAVGGDVVVYKGGEVLGSATAIRGKVIIDGGHVRGELRSALPVVVPAAPTVPARTGADAVRHALMLVAGWFTVVLLVGLVVNIFSGAQLETVTRAMEQRFTAAFFLGLAAQVGALPLLLLICVALVLTVVGTLLVPFAIVAFVLGLAGIATLGAMAAVTVTGHAVVRSGGNVRARAIASLVAGTVLLALPWVGAALLVDVAWAEALVRLLAVAFTWVACTTGFGAALMARGGMHRVQVRMATSEVESAGWQTPTPISGVMAVRRPPTSPPAGTPR